jgi:hypothetical protein
MQSMKRRRLSSDAWRAMVEKFEGSGLSAEDFSRQERISVASLQRWWQVKARTEAGDGVAPAPTRSATKSALGAFVDLGALGSSGSRLELRLEFGGGVVLQLSRG